jgi:hypothetical protein
MVRSVNWGQALIPLGDGRYAIREDVLPPFSVLAIELRRWHEAYPTTAQVIRKRERNAVKLFDDERRPELSLADRVLVALKVAAGKGRRLGCKELCDILRASPKSKRVEKALRRFTRQGLVERQGLTKGATYALVRSASSVEGVG